MKKSLGLLLSVAIASNIGFAASLKSLEKNDVIKLFEDRTMTTISMVTLNGKLMNNTLTAYMNKNGSVVGQLTNKPKEGEQGDKGVWIVKDDGTLCFTWEHWESKKQTCVDVYKTNNMVVFVNTANGKFESAALVDYFKDGDQMN